MDNLKLYARIFGDDICVKLGIEKSAFLIFKGGKVTRWEGISLPDE